MNDSANPVKVKANRELSVGFGKCCISEGWKHPLAGTDEPGDRTVHDDLYASAMVVLCAGSPIAALVSLDLGLIAKPASDRIREIISDETGIPTQQIALHSTHTHAAYSGYRTKYEVLAGYVSSAITDAIAAARPATVAHACVELGPGYNFNRRVRLSDGLGAWCVMFNTDCRTENGRVEASKQIARHVENWGGNWDDLEMSKRETWTDDVIDSHLHVIAFKNESGEYLGTIVRFAGHPVVVSRAWIGNELSRDAVGYVYDLVAEATGGPCLYLTGPSGNLRLYCEEYTHDEAKRRGEKIGGHAITLLPNLKFEPFDRFVVGYDEVTLDLWDGFPSNLAEQERKLTEIETKVSDALAEHRSPAEIKKLSEQATRMRMTKAMLERPIITREEAESGSYDQPISAFDFGVASMVTFPCEVFLQVSLAVREQVGENVVTAQLTNGGHSYVPTDEEWHLGGYETTWCATAPDAADRYINAAVELLHRVRKA